MDKNRGAPGFLQAQSKFARHHLRIHDLVEVAHSEVYGLSILLAQIQHVRERQVAQRGAGPFVAAKLREGKADHVVAFGVAHEITHVMQRVENPEHRRFGNSRTLGKFADAQRFGPRQLLENAERALDDRYAVFAGSWFAHSLILISSSEALADGEGLSSPRP